MNAFTAALCPRCKTPLTLLEAPGIRMIAEMREHLPWCCSHCGEDSDLPDFRAEEDGPPRRRVGSFSLSKLQRRRGRLQGRVEYLQRRIANREGDVARGLCHNDARRITSFDVAEVSALTTALALFDQAIAAAAGPDFRAVTEVLDDLDESGLIDEDPPADIDEQLREHLGEVASMAGELRSLVGAAERTLLELTEQSGKAQHYQQGLAVVVEMLTGGNVDGALAHGREVLHG